MKKRRRGGDRGHPVPTLSDVEKDVCAVDVREGVDVGQAARPFQQRERLVDLPEPRAGGRLGDQGAKLEIRLQAVSSSSTRSSVPIASSNSRAAMAASAREIRPPSRSCSADEMPDSRNLRGTSSRTASHSRAASLGRTRPRSIWLTYSFENRPRPSSVCVRPRAMRSCRRRSPSAEGVGRRPGGYEAQVGCVNRKAFARKSEAACSRSEVPRGSPKRGIGQPERRLL